MNDSMGKMRRLYIEKLDRWDIRNTGYDEVRYYKVRYLDVTIYTDIHMGKI